MKNRLKEIREEKRMTQEELSTKSGVSRPTIVAIENNTAYNTTLNTLIKLSDALETSFDKIFLT